jgi:hypothetical protein
MKRFSFCGALLATLAFMVLTPAHAITIHIRHGPKHHKRGYHPHDTRPHKKN